MKFKPYEQVRGTIMGGDLLATGKSEIIKIVTHSELSHVCGAIWFGDRLVVAESHLKTGVVFVTASNFLSRCDGPVYWWPDCLGSSFSRQAYKNAVISKLGDRYESPKWMALRVAFGMSPPENERWYCSELERYARGMAGEDIRTVSPRAWPKDIAALYGGMETAVRIK